MVRHGFTAAAALLALAGCGDPAPRPAPTAAPSASRAASPSASSAPPTAAPDEPSPGSTAFVTVVRQQLPEIAKDRSDEDIALIAEQVCVGLSNDLPAADVVAETRTLGTQDAEATDDATARELIKLAIDKVCLDQAKRVDEF